MVRFLDHDLDVDPLRSGRRRERSPLLWFVAISLVLTQLLLLPAGYLLLRRPLPAPEPVAIEVAMVEPTAPPEPRQRPDVRASQPNQRHRVKPRPRPREAPPHPKPPEKTKPIEPPQLARLKMVEVNNPESERAPDDARYLSDKNRRVEKETRARFTNLNRSTPRSQPPQAAKRRQSAGKPKPRIAQNRRRRAPHKVSRIKHERRSALMRMRSTASAAKQAHPSQSLLADAATQPLPQRRIIGQHTPHRLSLDYRDFDRIYGPSAAKQREIARLSPSTPRGGRIAHKWQQIRSALENFIPEVQPGNQTALGTRANPFAVYIAQMHRTIHQLWGFGFLADLDTKPDGHPMNDMSLWTMIEVVVKPNGTVKKATIVRPSGILAYDAAALDTIFSAAPYPQSPRAIRSADGNVYLHWRFHRNHRQCGTFGVDPYILTKPPEGPIDAPLEEIHGSESQPLPHPRRLNRRESARVAAPALTHVGQVPSPKHHEEMKRASQPVVKAAPSSSARAASSGPRRVLKQFLEGFKRDDTRAMAAACAIPFSSLGRTVAKSRKELQSMLGSLLDEHSPSQTERPADVQLMTPMQARRRWGRLPPGMKYGADTLVGRATLGHTDVTLLLERKNGRWWITGLNR